MKVVLVYPLESHIMPLMQLLEGETMEPLGLLFLAGSLVENGIEVKIIDRRVDLRNCGYSLEKANAHLEDSLYQYRPDFVGCTTTSVHIGDANTIGRVAKRAVPGVTFAIGGAQATLFPNNTLDAIPSADVLFCGDGEIPLVRYLKQQMEPDTQRCVLVRGEEKEVLPYWTTDLSNLAHPVRSSSYGLSYVARNVVNYGASLGRISPKIGEVISSRGCNGRCNFCTVSKVVGHMLRFHDLEWIILELKAMADSGVDAVYFNDDVFTVDKKRAIRLCEMIIQHGLNKRLQWIAQSRVDAVDDDLLHAMKAAGCARIEYGFESGAAAILRSMRKNIDLSKYYETVEQTLRAGLSFQANIIYGYPGENDDTVQETIDFLSAVRPPSVLLSAFAAVPGSYVWEELKGKGLLREIDITGEWVPAHPCLAKVNYTEMSDRQWVHNLHRMMLYAPEALSFYRSHETLFRATSDQSGGLLIYGGEKNTAARMWGRNKRG